MKHYNTKRTRRFTGPWHMSNGETWFLVVPRWARGWERVRTLKAAP